MVDGVGAPPVTIGEEGEDAEQRADDVVAVDGGEEGAVTTVVLQDEEANEQACDRVSPAAARGRSSTASRTADSHDAPTRDEQQARGHQLEPGTAIIGTGKRRNQRAQRRFRGSRLSYLLGGVGLTSIPMAHRT